MLILLCFLITTNPLFAESMAYFCSVASWTEVCQTRNVCCRWYCSNRLTKGAPFLSLWQALRYMRHDDYL